MKGRFHIVEERIGTHLLKSRATGWYHPSLLALTHILTPRAFCAALSPCMLCERHEPVAKVRADPSRHYTAVTKGERMIPHHGKANTHTLCKPHATSQPSLLSQTCIVTAQQPLSLPSTHAMSRHQHRPCVNSTVTHALFTQEDQPTAAVHLSIHPPPPTAAARGPHPLAHGPTCRHRKQHKPEFSMISSYSIDLAYPSSTASAQHIYV